MTGYTLVSSSGPRSPVRKRPSRTLPADSARDLQEMPRFLAEQLRK